MALVDMPTTPLNEHSNLEAVEDIAPSGSPYYIRPSTKEGLPSYRRRRGLID